ncbi:MAG TPA: DUF2330 domain-containing protein [Polyangiaceae bacterium]
MRSIYSVGLVASFLFISGEALPCGGAFGTNFVIQPAQKIVVSVHDGIETYIFNPSFCGSAAAFGLILPVPATLKDPPSLSSAQLYTDLTGLTAPTIVERQECSGRGLGGSASNGSAGGTGVKLPGTVVVQAGHVGIFDWTLLKANSVASFTDWLTSNGYPYQASATNTFQPYVSDGWYFVAFKVSSQGGTGSAGAPNAGSSIAPNTQICGDFGPVSLSFAASPNAVIPARIAAVSSSSLQWDIYTIAAKQQRVQSVSTTLRFSGTVGTPELTKYPSLSSVAKPGDRVTEMLLSQAPSSDLVLEPDPGEADYRRTEYKVQYISCTGGASSGGSSSSSEVARSGSGPLATGGAASGGNSATGSPITTGGSIAYSNPLTSSTGGNLGNGGSVVVATGGVQSGSLAPILATSGGQGVQTGGATSEPSSSMARGGASARGGAPATGGNNATSSAPITQRDDSDHDGCAINRTHLGTRQTALLAMAIAMLSRLRLRRRRSNA